MAFNWKTQITKHKAAVRRRLAVAQKNGNQNQIKREKQRLERLING